MPATARPRPGGFSAGTAAPPWSAPAAGAERPPPVAITLGSTYADPGATCADLPVMVSTHQLGTTVLGEQWVFYACRDGAGNGTVVEP